jgi:murein DD-endopeptidase MepM/ murein hydrolase activator NlpD
MLLQLLLVFVASPVNSQTFSVTPKSVRQGETIHVRGGEGAKSVRLNERTVPLFPQTDGTTLGLMPVAIGAKPGPYQLEYLNGDKSTIHSESMMVLNAHYARQNVVLSKALTQLKSNSDERERVEAFRNLVSPTRYWEEPLEAPVPGCLTSPFGVQRLHNGKPTGDYHAGLDQRSPAGAPIHAVAAGIVKIVSKFELRGGTVAIDHGQGLESIYLHMSDFAAKEGQHVQKRDVIGYVGSSGRSTAPHLHWTLYVNSQPVSPTQWIKNLKPCAAPASARSKKRDQ